MMIVKINELMRKYNFSMDYEVAITCTNTYSIELEKLMDDIFHINPIENVPYIEEVGKDNSIIRKYSYKDNNGNFNNDLSPMVFINNDIPSGVYIDNNIEKTSIAYDYSKLVGEKKGYSTKLITSYEYIYWYKFYANKKGLIRVVLTHY